MQVRGRQVRLEMSCSIYQVEWELKRVSLDGSGWSQSLGLYDSST